MRAFEKVFDCLGALTRPLDKPSTWPAPARRIYILTLPISLPLQCLYAGVFFLLASTVAAGLAMYLWVHSVWTGGPSQ